MTNMFTTSFVLSQLVLIVLCLIMGTSSLTQLSRSKTFGGEQYVFSHNSSVTNVPMRFGIFFPPAFVTPPNGRVPKLPVLYILGGLTNSVDDLVNEFGYQESAAANNLIVICPDTRPRNTNINFDQSDMFMGPSYYMDATTDEWRHNYRYFTYITDELHSLILANFPTEIDQNRIGVTGFSTGGHGAFMLAFKLPEQYKSVSALAPACNSGSPKFGTARAYEAMLGSDHAKWLEWDAADVLKNYRGPYFDILIDHGTFDERLDRLQPWLIPMYAAGKNVAVTLNMRPMYKHDLYLVRTFIAYHIEHHARILKKL